MGRRLAGVIVALSLCACSFRGSNPSGQADAVDAAVVPDAPEGPCNIDEPRSCVAGQVLRECEGEAGYKDTTCILGCLDDNGPHCGEFTPSNGVAFGTSTTDWIFAANTSYRVLGDGRIVETDPDGVLIAEIRPSGEGIDPATGIGFTVQSQGQAAPELGVYSFRSLTIEPTATVRLIGNRAIALAAPGEITIRGVLDLGAGLDACARLSLDCAGPGAGRGGVGGGAAAAVPGESRSGDLGIGGPGNMGDAMAGGESGGGGGGFGTTGGDSGASAGSAAAPGGAAWSPTELIPIVGGPGGGGGGGEQQDQSVVCTNGPDYPGGVGGGGGGGVQIASGSRVELVQVGADECAIDAGGAGGGSGDCSAAGGGGGAGGGILIEAPTISIGVGCVVAANGGGGGASNNEAGGLFGADGLRSDLPAPGGGVDTEQGGSGAAGVLAAGNSMDSANESAGGGGGIGRIVLRALSTGISTAGILSPQHAALALDVF